MADDEPIIRVEQIEYTYRPAGREPVRALAGLSLTVRPGEYVAIVGANGSGKSTLAKHLNALLKPQRGEVWVAGLNTKDPANTRSIRQTVGMVFQNPDNQLVATIVEEDVAFGPENLGLPAAEIRRRIEHAMEQVDVAELRHRQPHLLSGGQKQRVAIAGVLAMEPRVLVLDEATALLDPLGRREVLDTVQRLHRRGRTIIHITHFMAEAAEAERVVVLSGGRQVLDGPPREVFGQAELLRRLGLEVPPMALLAERLCARGLDLPTAPLTVAEMAEALQALAGVRR